MSCAFCPAPSGLCPLHSPAGPARTDVDSRVQALWPVTLSPARDTPARWRRSGTQAAPVEPRLPPPLEWPAAWTPGGTRRAAAAGFRPAQPVVQT